MKLILSSIMFALSTIALVYAPHASAADPSEMEAALAQLDAALPGDLINNPLDLKWELSGEGGSGKIRKSSDIPAGYFYQAKVKAAQRNPWDLALRFPLTQDISTGDVVQMSFWARTEKPVKGAETANFIVSIGRSVAPYEVVFNKTATPGGDWQLYTVKGVAENDIPAKEGMVAFNLGGAKQTVELSQFYVMNLGPAGGS